MISCNHPHDRPSRDRYAGLGKERACLLLLERVAMRVGKRRTLETALETALVDVIAELCAFGAFDAGCVWLVPDEHGEEEVRWHVEPSVERSRLTAVPADPTLGKSARPLHGEVLTRQREVWVEDLADWPADGRCAAARAAGLRTALAFPAQSGDSIVAVLELYGRDRAAVGDVPVHVISSVGAVVGQAIERWRVKRSEEHQWRRTRAILDHAPLAFVSADQHGLIDVWNPAAERLFGWSAAEALGRPLADRVRVSDGTLLATEPEVAPDGGPRALRRVTVTDRGGNAIPVEVYATRLDIDGRSTTYAFAQDVRARVVAEQLLLRRERQLADAQRIGRIGSWEWDIVNDEITWSDEMYRIFGLDPETFDGSYEAYLEILHPDDRERMNQAVGDARAHARPFAARHRAYHASGKLITLQARGEVFTDADGNVVRMAGTGQDITEQLEADRAERALLRERERAQALERSNRELEEFAYIASHDLHEPLRTITGYLDLIQRRYGDALDEDAREFIAFAAEGATRMNDLLDDLLSYSRVTSKARPNEPVDLNDIVAEVQENLARAITEADAVLTIEALPTVSADRRQMLQLMQNLIGNALKFRGDAPARIELRAGPAEDGDYVTVEVTDHGIGFDPQYARKLFIIFQRLDSTTPGTGIGLAICRKIAERHGGTITAEGRPGDGATFRVTLPITG